MKTFETYCLAEMARPAKSFADLDMNNAYASSLKKFKVMGVDNANTFIIWDFIFRQLPEFFKQEKFIELKKKSGGTNMRIFVLDMLKSFPDKVNMHQLAADINDESKIRAYLDRPDRGNRHIGRVRADAQEFIDTLSRPQSNGLA